VPIVITADCALAGVIGEPSTITIPIVARRTSPARVEALDQRWPGWLVLPAGVLGDRWAIFLVVVLVVLLISAVAWLVTAGWRKP
jgi:hypothetical protein